MFKVKRGFKLESFRRYKLSGRAISLEKREGVRSATSGHSSFERFAKGITDLRVLDNANLGSL